jgi:hypothetical protein
LVDAVGADPVVGVGAGAEVSFGSGAVGGGGGLMGHGAVGAPPRDTITQLTVCSLRHADRYRPREFAYASRTALLTNRRAVRSTNHLVTRRA